MSEILGVTKSILSFRLLDILGSIYEPSCQQKVLLCWNLIILINQCVPKLYLIWVPNVSHCC